MNIQWTMAIMVPTIVTLIAIVGLCPTTGALANEGVLWRFLMVSKDKLLARTTGGYNITTNTTVHIPAISCILECQKLTWCNTWCVDPGSASSYSFFEMFLVGNYREKNLTNALRCYTRKSPDYGVDATIYGADPRDSYPSRVKENLIDGIYPFGNKEECHWSSDQWDPWIKIDLGSAKPIRYVRMVPLSDAKAEQMYDIEIRAGSVDVGEANIKDNPVFGYFAGPAVPSEMTVFTHEPPVVAQFVTFQRYSNRSICKPDGLPTSQECSLHLCHIEISN